MKTQNLTLQVIKKVLEEHGINCYPKRHKDKTLIENWEVETVGTHQVDLGNGYKIDTITEIVPMPTNLREVELFLGY